MTITRPSVSRSVSQPKTNKQTTSWKIASARRPQPFAGISRGRTLVLRVRSRCDDPGGIHSSHALPGRGAESEREAKICVYLRRIQGKHGRLAPLSRKAFRHERQRKSLLRAENHWRRRQRSAHATRPPGDPVARRRRNEQRLHAHSARAIPARFRGGRSRSCPSRSCCFRAGLRFTWRRCRTGRVPS